MEFSASEPITPFLARSTFVYSITPRTDRDALTGACVVARNGPGATTVFSSVVVFGTRLPFVLMGAVGSGIFVAIFFASVFVVLIVFAVSFFAIAMGASCA